MRSLIVVAWTMVAVPALATAQPVQVVHRFEVPPHAPLGGLVEAADGNLYGTTSKGGAGGGTIYRVPAGGGPPVVVHRFMHGRRPEVSLVPGGGGVLYGTTSDGGVLEAGTVFRFDPATGQLTTLHTFALGDGRDPVGRVLQASNGLLYGTTASPDGGRIYELDPVTGRVRWLHTFDQGGALGAMPSGGLTEAPNGFLYGLTEQVGQASTGTIYKLDRTTGVVTRVHLFTGLDGGRPVAGLTRTSDGLLYGVTRSLGAAAIFRVDPATDTVSVAHAITTPGDAFASRLVEAADGSLYGTTILGHIVRLQRPSGGGHVLTTVHVIERPTEGGDPLADLALAADGWIWGTTIDSGASGGGTLFRFDSQQRGSGSDPFQFQVLHAFSSRSSGWRPVGPPITGSDGALYGLTEAGGANDSGVVFRLDPVTGGFTVVGSIALSGASGPTTPRHSPLVDGGDGSLYALVGTASNVGRRLIRVTPAAGTLTQLYEFPAQSGALRVLPTLVAGPGGLFGVRSGLGEPPGVFRFDLATPAAPLVASLAPHFPDGIEGAGMTAAADGSLYVQAYSRIPVDGDGPSTIARVLEVSPAAGTARVLATIPDGGAGAPALGLDGRVTTRGTCASRSGHSSAPCTPPRWPTPPCVRRQSTAWSSGSTSARMPRPTSRWTSWAPARRSGAATRHPERGRVAAW